MALLAALLVSNRALEKVAEFLEPEHFGSEVHGRIYEAIRKLTSQGSIANPVTLAPYFDKDPALASLPGGGAAYLAKLAANVVTLVNTQDYGRQILDAYRRRELVQSALGVIEECTTPELDRPAEIIARDHEERVWRLMEGRGTSEGPIPIAKATERALAASERAWKADGRLTGVSTGLVDLNKILGGLHPGNLIILAARPGQGKSACATGMAYDASVLFREEARRTNTPAKEVAFFSVEMSVEEIGHRLLARPTGLAAERQRQGRLTPEDFEALVAAHGEMPSLPFWVDETSALSMSLLRMRARRMARRAPLGLVIVDYLQLMDLTRGENRNIEIGTLTRSLKQLSKELGVPIVALSQLNRGVEQREDKRPLLSDLRDSGSIEQDADVVLFLFREEYYIQQQEPRQKADEGHDKFQERLNGWLARLEKCRHRAEIIVAKNRMGESGRTVLCRWDGPRATIHNWAYTPDDGRPV